MTASYHSTVILHFGHIKIMEMWCCLHSLKNALDANCTYLQKCLYVFILFIHPHLAQRFKYLCDPDSHQYLISEENEASNKHETVILVSAKESIY